MATANTLAGAITVNDWILTLGSPSTIKAGDSIVCEQESMMALVVNGQAITVYRGSRGTAGKAHAAGVAASYGPPSGFGVGVGVTSFEAEAADEAAARRDLKPDLKPDHDLPHPKPDLPHAKPHSA